MTATPTSLAPFLDVATDLARRAGRAAMAELPFGRWRGGGVEHKSSRELVSRVDRAVERLIVDGLRESFADHTILAEESGAVAGARPEAEWRWHVDPIDGTTNFLHGHPFFCVSIALERLALAPGPAPDIVIAAIYLPYFDELYFAERGAGAYLNSRSMRLSVSPTTELADALVATGFAYDRERYPNFRNFERLAAASFGIHRCGSAAIDLAFVAAGRYDAFWELGLRPHDVAAGALLTTEAGGEVTDFLGQGDWLTGRSIVASNGALHEAVRARLEPWPEPERG